MTSTTIDFHENMDKLSKKIEGILKGPLRKEQIYFVNGEAPEMKESFSSKLKKSMSQNAIENGPSRRMKFK